MTQTNWDSNRDHGIPPWNDRLADRRPDAAGVHQTTPPGSEEPAGFDVGTAGFSIISRRKS